MRTLLYFLLFLFTVLPNPISQCNVDETPAVKGLYYQVQHTPQDTTYYIVVEASANVDSLRFDLTCNYNTVSSPILRNELQSFAWTFKTHCKRLTKISANPLTSAPEWKYIDMPLITSLPDTL